MNQDGMIPPETSTQVSSPASQACCRMHLYCCSLFYMCMKGKRGSEPTLPSTSGRHTSIETLAARIERDFLQIFAIHGESTTNRSCVGPIMEDIKALLKQVTEDGWFALQNVPYICGL
ncbi:hypothetical protein L3X38_038402 [Prunus dulcis]|uniref:Uncharacterized protein n=1 Tax=Prunus dulcis TaxID=3755 RepID=A0AAD4V6E5_PRUDU|nr:hypothetical protein L3X38_038402 [Prunus dulcis]